LATTHPARLLSAIEGAGAIFKAVKIGVRTKFSPIPGVVEGGRDRHPSQPEADTLKLHGRPCEGRWTIRIDKAGEVRARDIQATERRNSRDRTTTSQPGIPGGKIHMKLRMQRGPRIRWRPKELFHDDRPRPSAGFRSINRHSPGRK